MEGRFVGAVARGMQMADVAKGSGGRKIYSTLLGSISLIFCLLLSSVVHTSAHHCKRYMFLELATIVVNDEVIISSEKKSNIHARHLLFPCPGSASIANADHVGRCVMTNIR